MRAIAVKPQAQETDIKIHAEIAKSCEKIADFQAVLPTGGRVRPQRLHGGVVPGIPGGGLFDTRLLKTPVLFVDISEGEITFGIENRRVEQPRMD